MAATDNNYTDRCLRRPDDDFWLWDDYVETFGDPTEPKNRKKGHTKSVMEGVKGVVVPGGQKGPWKVEYRAGGRQNLEKTLDCGSSGGEEEIAEQQFSQASNLANEAYSRICTGAVAGVLAGLELTTAEKEEQADARSARKKKKKQRSKEQGRKKKKKKKAAVFCRLAL